MKLWNYAKKLTKKNKTDDITGTRKNEFVVNNHLTRKKYVLLLSSTKFLRKK